MEGIINTTLWRLGHTVFRRALILSLTTLSLSAAPFFLGSSASAESIDSDVEVKVRDVIAMSLTNCDNSNSSTIKLTVVPISTGSFKNSCQTVTINTNSPGYSLTVKASSSTLNYLNSTTISPAPTIASTTSDINSPSSLAKDTWGFAVEGNGNFDAIYATDNQNNKYASLPTSDTTIYQTNVFPIPQTNHKFFYGVNLSTNTMAGTYASTITYTGVGVDVPAYVPEGTTWVIDETCNAQIFEAPTNGIYKLEAWGAQGGGNALAGKGGYSVGEVSLKSHDTLYVVSGGVNGCNGGGSSPDGFVSESYGEVKTNGGGASDVRLNVNSLHSRLIVAGGGGGVGTSYSNYLGGKFASLGSGGVGGGNNGGDGTISYYNSVVKQGLGGSLVSGGAGATSFAGYFGIGGSGNILTLDSERVFVGGGGGGGWYGGSAAQIVSATGNVTASVGGGGGSGWVYTPASYESWSTGNLSDASNWLLDGSYYLTNVQLFGGDQSFISPSGGFGVGNTGNGQVRITFLGY